MDKKAQIRSKLIVEIDPNSGGVAEVRWSCGTDKFTIARYGADGELQEIEGEVLSRPHLSGSLYNIVDKIRGIADILTSAEEIKSKNMIETIRDYLAGKISFSLLLASLNGASAMQVIVAIVGAKENVSDNA